MMKASVFTWEYPPAIYGGAGVHAKYITMALAKRIKVEVRTLDVGAPPEIEGVNILRYQATLRGLATGDPRILKALQVLSFNMNMVAYPIPASKVAVIHNGVDPQKYYPRDGVESLAKFSIRTPFVFFVGRLSRQKGIFDLLHAMDHVPGGTTLVLATGKPDTPGIEDDLRAALKARNDVVWIRDMLEDHDLVNLYNEAAVFACPSVYEPFGIINLEAMACETPVIATRVGGIKEVVVDEETGPFGRPVP